MRQVPDWNGYLRFRDAFAGVMDRRLYSPEWLDSRILDGSAQFWSTEDAAAITELRTYPTGARDLHWLVAAGRLEDVVNVIRPCAEEWARARGCVGSVVESREGWARVLKRHGYELFQVSVRKGL